jgi:tungstate transport system substrate-binding protein
VQNSGLLDALLPAYRNDTGVEVRVHAAGSGRALAMLEEGLARLVISHAPDAEARALQQHGEWIRRPLAQNRFVIVGPANDPAGIRSARDATNAFARIARANAAFVSRGDQSGTHERENGMWQLAGVRPAGDRYVISGRGMALALRHADELRAYTLSDEATFRQLGRQIELVLLYQGDPLLLNVYSVIHPRSDAPAARFAEWLVTGEGRRRIDAFTIEGKRMFEPPSPPQ